MYNQTPPPQDHQQQYTRLSEKREQLKRQHAEFRSSMQVLLFVPTLLAMAVAYFMPDFIPGKILAIAWACWVVFVLVITLFGSMVYGARLRALD